MVLDANAVVDPGAVMVEPLNTPVANVAVWLVYFLPAVPIYDFMVAKEALEDYPVHNWYFEGIFEQFFFESSFISLRRSLPRVMNSQGLLILPLELLLDEMMRSEPEV